MQGGNDFLFQLSGRRGKEDTMPNSQRGRPRPSEAGLMQGSKERQSPEGRAPSGTLVGPLCGGLDIPSWHFFCPRNRGIQAGNLTSPTTSAEQTLSASWDPWPSLVMSVRSPAPCHGRPALSCRPGQALPYPPQAGLPSSPAAAAGPTLPHSGLTLSVGK